MRKYNTCVRADEGGIKPGAASELKRENEVESWKFTNSVLYVIQ
jgi:hypothetical protein